MPGADGKGGEIQRLRPKADRLPEQGFWLGLCRLILWTFEPK